MLSLIPFLKKVNRKKNVVNYLPIDSMSSLNASSVKTKTTRFFFEAIVHHPYDRVLSLNLLLWLLLWQAKNEWLQVKAQLVTNRYKFFWGEYINTYKRSSLQFIIFHNCSYRLLNSFCEKGCLHNDILVDAIIVFILRTVELSRKLVLLDYCI